MDNRHIRTVSCKGVAPSILAVITPTMDDPDTILKLACKLAGVNFMPISDLGSDETGFFAELTKLQSQIHLIRSQYRRRFNAIRSSTAALPNEILIHIFRFACSTAELRDGSVGCPQILLGSVSSHWRDIVVNIPELWDTFSVKISEKNFETTMPLLEMYFARRGQMPSSIQLNLQGLDYSRTKILESLTLIENRMFLGNAPKFLHAMNVHCPPPDWLSTIVSECPCLQELALSWTPQSTGTYTWSRRLRTSSPGLSSLRILRLNRVPIMLCFDLLLGCPNLIEFTCTTPLIHARNDPDGWMMMHRNEEVTFPQLEHLAWTPTTEYWDNYFLKFFRFPSLRHFSWKIWPGQHSREFFVSFVATLPPSLATFEIRSSLLIAWHWIEKIFQQMPRITKLIVTDVLSFAYSRFLQILQNPTVLPSLKVFKWVQKVKGEIGQYELWVSHLYEMLLQKKIRGVKEFRYEMVNVEMCLRAEDREVISRLKHDGFQVDIVCDGSTLEL